MTRTLRGLMVIGILAISLGCQGLNTTEFTALWNDKAPGKPNEIGAIWQEGVDIQLDPNHGGMPVPGFAGRVFFMQTNAGKGPAVLVDGTLLIQLFEDKPYQGMPTPLETWTILPEHLPMLVKKDLTGWGYSLWLPWHTFNPNIRRVKMTVQYQGKDGTRLTSEPMQIQIQDARRGGLPKPEVKVEHVPKKTWLNTQ